MQKRELTNDSDWLRKIKRGLNCYAKNSLTNGNIVRVKRTLTSAIIVLLKIQILTVIHHSLAALRRLKFLSSCFYNKLLR